jgi:hypothetical protein
MENEATVTWHGVLDMQVCAPKDWTDEQVEDFANKKNPCGGVNLRCQIIREGDKFLAGAKERTPCEKEIGHVHVMLDC